jgi:hypothetical protein
LNGYTEWFARACFEHIPAKRNSRQIALSLRTTSRVRWLVAAAASNHPADYYGVAATTAAERPVSRCAKASICEIKRSLVDFC